MSIAKCITVTVFSLTLLSACTTEKISDGLVEVKEWATTSIENVTTNVQKLIGAETRSANGTPQGPLYCYSTLAAPDCYKEPLPGAENRLIAFYPAPEKEEPEPVAVQQPAPPSPKIDTKPNSPVPAVGPMSVFEIEPQKDNTDKGDFVTPTPKPAQNTPNQDSNDKTSIITPKQTPSTNTNGMSPPANSPTQTTPQKSSKYYAL